MKETKIKLKLTPSDLAMSLEELAEHVKQVRTAYIAQDIAMLAIANILVNHNLDLSLLA